MNPFSRLFDQRIRGFRIIEVAALACLVLMVFWVYMAKAGAGGERAQISQIENQILEEQRRLKLLRAETAHLEQPARIEALSEAYLGLKPIDAKRETGADSLVEIARRTGGGPQ